MNHVKELRIKAGMQQKELAIALNVQQPSVSRWEQQKADPTDENVDKLAALFGVSPNDIIYYWRPEPPRYEAPARDDDEDDTWALRERYRRDPNYRLLFDAAERATPEHLRAAAAMLKALEGTTDD